jgi:hypothetical protein
MSLLVFTRVYPKVSTAPSGRELYHLQFWLQAVSPEIFGCILIDARCRFSQQINRSSATGVRNNNETGKRMSEVRKRNFWKTISGDGCWSRMNVTVTCFKKRFRVCVCVCVCVEWSSRYVCLLFDACVVGGEVTGTGSCVPAPLTDWPEPSPPPQQAVEWQV